MELKKVVGIGASAGGLKALEKFFQSAPRYTGNSYIVIQHLSPDFKSLMDDLLARHTEMPIYRAEENMEIEADSIYLIPPKKLMRLREGKLHLSERHGEKGLEFPINVFFKSLAEDQRERAVGIILSGTGSDGSDGVVEIEKNGGLVLVQNSETATFDGMPQSAIKAGHCHMILTPEEMPETIIHLQDPAHYPELIRPSDQIEFDGDGAEMRTIIGALHDAFGIDFSLYKKATVFRRIERRMSFLNITSPVKYGIFLKENGDEAEALYRDLLIGVTEFFRDPDVFEFLEDHAIEHILKRADREIRIWVAGCATGEEVYSLAIVFDEQIRKFGWKGKLTIFATDAHRSSLNRAALGVYSKEALGKVSEERLRLYFTVQEDGLYKIRAEIRQNIVFAPHNVIVDPPFTRMDFVSCRNLLIYLKPHVQEKVLQLFNYALKKEGILFLGTSEGLARLEGEFSKMDSRHKVFLKRSEDGHLPGVDKLDSSSRGRSLALRRMESRGLPTVALDKKLLASYDFVLGNYAPTGVIIDEQREVQHYFGQIEKYLKPMQGRIEKDVISRLVGDLQLVTSSLLQRAMANASRVVSKGVSTGESSGRLFLDIIIDPIVLEGERFYYYISFREANEGATSENIEAVENNMDSAGVEILEVARKRISELEGELIATRENLQATVEELQTSNEELQATNEELLASNEELQSTNEELHSVNEELYTVNAEYERKNKDLNRLNQDHDSLLSSLEEGIVFIDENLLIRKYNPAISKSFKILPQDIGRPIDHIAYQLQNQQEMLDSVLDVLSSGRTVEEEVRTRGGEWMLKRIQPFYGLNNKIEGVVLSFTDISMLKEMEDRLSLAMRSALLVWWDWDLISGRLSTHAQDWCILGYTASGLAPTAEGWMDLVHPDEQMVVRRSLDDYLSGNGTEWNCEHRFKDHQGDWRWVHNVGTVVSRDKSGKPLRMIGTTQDIHTRKEAQNKFHEIQDQYRHAVDGLVFGYIICSKQADATNGGYIVNVSEINDRMRTVLGNRSSVIGQSLLEIVPALSSEKLTSVIDESHREGKMISVQAVEMQYAEEALKLNIGILANERTLTVTFERI